MENMRDYIDYIVARQKSAEEFPQKWNEWLKNQIPNFVERLAAVEKRQVETGEIKVADNIEIISAIGLLFLIVSQEDK